jgi:hypothetical protein
MIEQHYAGVIENWDGRRVPAGDQIRAARRLVDPKWTLRPIS